MLKAIFLALVIGGPILGVSFSMVGHNDAVIPKDSDWVLARTADVATIPDIRQPPVQQSQIVTPKPMVTSYSETIQIIRDGQWYAYAGVEKNRLVCGLYAMNSNGSFQIRQYANDQYYVFAITDRRWRIANNTNFFATMAVDDRRWPLAGITDTHLVPMFTFALTSMDDLKDLFAAIRKGKGLHIVPSQTEVYQIAQNGTRTKIDSPVGDAENEIFTSPPSNQGGGNLDFSLIGATNTLNAFSNCLEAKTIATNSGDIQGFLRKFRQ